MRNDNKDIKRNDSHHGPMKVNEKPRDFKNSIKRLFNELTSFRWIILIALVLAILSSVLSIYAPNKLRDLTDEISSGFMFGINMNNIRNIVLFLGILYIVSALSSFSQALCMANVSNKFAKMLRSRISVKINNLPLSYFDKHRYGDTLSRITNDIDTIAQSMNQSLAGLVSDSVLFVGSLIMMFITNWILAITAIVSSIFGFVFMFMILGKSQKYFTQKQKELGNLNGYIEEVYSGLNVH